MPTGRRQQQGADVLTETRYLDLAGELKGSESLHLLGPDQRLAAYHFEDLGSGELTAVSVSGDEAKVQIPRREGRCPANSSAAVVGADDHRLGIARADCAALGRAARGKTVNFELLVPFRLATVGFRVNLRDEPSSGQPLIVVAEARNWLIRQLAPQISFTYADESPPRLIRYEGPAPVMIGTDKGKAVQINFAVAH